MRAPKVMVLAAVCLLAGCDDRFPDYHYKMTIYVGGKAYSSVRAVKVTEVDSIMNSRGKTDKTELSGEAVVLDLPGRSVPVFALLARPDNADYGWQMPRYALMEGIPLVPNEIDGKALDEMDQAALDLQHMVAVKGPKELPRTIPAPWNRGRTGSAWPFFVTFGDITNPKTVHEVSPGEIGVSKITIEITDEPVTAGIERRLGWLSGLHGGYLSGRSTARGAPYGLHGGFFSSELF